MTALERGQIWWADLPDPTGSGPGFRRPVLIVQSDSFNASSIATVLVAPITSNLRLALAPGNVLLKPEISGLSRDSVVNVSQLIAINRRLLSELIGPVGGRVQTLVDKGLRLLLAL